MSSLALPAFCLLVLGYFGFHAVMGNFGMHSRALIERDAMWAELELARLQAERAELEHRVGLLADGKLERDMLDEQARRVIGVAGEADLVIFRD